MGKFIGVLASERIAVGLVDDNRVAGEIHSFPEDRAETDTFVGLPAEEIVNRLRNQIDLVRADGPVEAVGLGFPGIIMDGVVEDSPNLPQIKGQNIAVALAYLLNSDGPSLPLPVHVLNDADAMAAGVAATRGQLDKLIRVWTLGVGIGFGRYPQAPGAWEGGHMVVSLDPKEHYCGCGGVGHLEGIMGYRAMRLRFLDLEPEEVFQHAADGDKRCVSFVKRWHRALAAATATSIHLDGPGKIYISGPMAKYVDLNMVEDCLHGMVKLSPLQG